MPRRAPQRRDDRRQHRAVEAVLRRHPGQRREGDALRQHDQRADEARRQVGAQRRARDAMAPREKRQSSVARGVRDREAGRDRRRTAMQQRASVAAGMRARARMRPTLRERCGRPYVEARSASGASTGAARRPAGRRCRVACAGGAHRRASDASTQEAIRTSIESLRAGSDDRARAPEHDAGGEAARDADQRAQHHQRRFHRRRDQDVGAAGDRRTAAPLCARRRRDSACRA